MVPLKAEPAVTPSELLEARKTIGQIYVADKVKDYIVDVVFATREPAKHGLKDLAPLIEFGASPRASIALNLAALCYYPLRGQGRVVLKAKIDAIRGLPGVLRRRRCVQSTRTVGAWALRRSLKRGVAAAYSRYTANPPAQ